MNVETHIHLNKFQPRPYQLPICDALENKKFKKLVAIMPRRCLSGQSHILLANGSFKLLKDITVGDSVLSWDGSKFVPDIVKNSWRTSIKKTTIIQSPGYLPITSSDDHVFATGSSESKSSIIWKKVKNFAKQSKLLQYGGLHHGTLDNPDLAEFLGYMLADGYVCDYQQPKFTNTNMTILNRVEELAFSLFGYKAIWRPKGNGYDLGFSNGTRGGGATPNKIKELFRKYGCDVSKYKRRLLPLAWEFNEKSLLRFFAGLIAADGSIYLHKTGFRASDTQRDVPPAVEITINCGLAEFMGWDIYWLLRKMGIVPQVPYKERGSNIKIKISKQYAVKKLLSTRIYGKEKKQSEILDAIDTQKKQTSKINGCFRSSYTLKDGDDEFLYDIETEKYHNFVANGYVVHNSGKDILAWNLMIRAALRKVGNYFYCLPTYRQAKLVIWDSITNSGERFLDYIPKELIERTNSQEMKIIFTNGSIIQLIGSDTYDTSLVGTNPRMVVFSEWALSDSRAYNYVRPILNANDGTVIFLSTPRGRNHLWELYNIARNLDDWFCYKLTVEDTNHISLHDIQREIANGEISEDLAQQEYWCSFTLGVEGAYYTKYLDRMRLKNQIGHVPWEPGFPVHTAWDLGVRDSTCILFFQVIGQTVRIIDSYENSKHGLEHYISIVKQKEYVYGKHFAPHDIRVREFTTGMARIEKARQLGVTFLLAPNIPIQDGIEAVRSSLSKIWIDETNCVPLLKALENYRQEYDSKKKIYRDHPLHDWSSHMADCLRYLCLSLSKTRDSLSPELLEKRYQEAIYGDKAHLPKFFQGI